MKKILTIAAMLAVLPAVSGAETFQKAFESNRAMYGKGHSFEWNGKSYSTNHEEEVEAMVDPTKANAMDLIARAKEKNEEVAKLGFEWKLTKEIIESAEEAADAGEFQKALDLAAQAKYHARMGIEQYHHAEKNWQLAVPQ